LADKRGFGLLDYVVVLVKWKRLVVTFAASLLVISYLAIYFFVEEQYEATATILPAEDKQIGGLSTLMRTLSPIALGLGAEGKSPEMDLYTTVITSRSTLEKVIRKFDLLAEFHLKSMEDAVKVLQKKIRTEITDQNAYKITVRANSRQKAGDLAYYVLELLNQTIIDLNVAKSKNNRLFLEQRYKEMSTNLRKAEDSLQYYQERSGMLEAKEQTKMVIETYSRIESELITRQLQLSILQNTYADASPQLDNLRLQIREYQAQLDKMKMHGRDNSVILALATLPQKAKNYVRHYRDVEVYSRILEFIVPLYEQARFEEQKDIPVLQVVDPPVPPEHKVYPPRVLFSIMITFGGCMLLFCYILVRENHQWLKSEQVRWIIDNLSRWKESR
jgi:tyrosine-protein kinase Etk/Wzc